MENINPFERELNFATQRFKFYLESTFAEQEKHCESPIEKLFLQAWINKTYLENSIKSYDAFEFHAYNSDFILNDRFKESITARVKRLGLISYSYLVPQFKIDKYRIDFLIVCCHASLPLIMEFDDFFTENYKDYEKTYFFKVLIECDGFEYHGKSKEQFIKDREKDRFLKYLGYDVLRFSGTELYKNPDQCLEETIQILNTKYEDYVKPIKALQEKRINEYLEFKAEK
jgi:hypothetical protein